MTVFKTSITKKSDIMDRHYVGSAEKSIIYCKWGNKYVYLYNKVQEIISTTTKKRAFSPKYIYQKGIRWAIPYTLYPFFPFN